MTESKPSASPWRRLMSATYESIILFGVVFFFGYAFSAIVQFKGHPSSPAHTGLQIFLAIVLGAYFTYFWSKGRRTLPMKTMDLALLGPDSLPLTPLRAMSRYLVALGLGLAALAATKYLSGWLFPLVLLPWLPTVIDRQRRALYDIVCGTRLVVSPLPKKPRA